MNEDSQNEGLEENNGEVDDKIISNGWSMSVGALKAALKDVPDDYEVMLTCADVDDCEISDINVGYLYPPSLGSNGLLLLEGGQTVTSEYAFHVRMDVDHKIGTSKHWNTQTKEWSRWA